MEILKMTENGDGSVTVEISLTDEENNILIGYAINDILRKQIATMEGKDECSCKSGDSCCKK